MTAFCRHVCIGTGSGIGMGIGMGVRLGATTPPAPTVPGLVSFKNLNAPPRAGALLAAVALPRLKVVEPVLVPELVVPDPVPVLGTLTPSDLTVCA